MVVLVKHWAQVSRMQCSKIAIQYSWDWKKEDVDGGIHTPAKALGPDLFNPYRLGKHCCISTI